MYLRPYQIEAVNAVYDHLQMRDDNPCVVLPTAAGKSLVIARICSDAVLRWGGRVLILAHVKELLQQNADKLRRLAPEVNFGVYSAGLKSRKTKEPVIIAGIQSVHKKACTLGRFDLILVDESHLLPESGEGMYRTFMKEAKIVNPNVRLIGFTATPYRLSSGMLCKPENLLNHVCYEKGIKELIHEGFLCRIHTKVPAEKIDCSKIHVRNGEFRSEEVAELFNAGVQGFACHATLTIPLFIGIPVTLLSLIYAFMSKSLRSSMAVLLTYCLVIECTLLVLLADSRMVLLLGGGPLASILWLPLFIGVPATVLSLKSALVHRPSRLHVSAMLLLAHILLFALNFVIGAIACC